MIFGILVWLVLIPIKLFLAFIGLFVVAALIPFGYVIDPAPLWDGNRIVYSGWVYKALPGWTDKIWGSPKYGAYGNWFWPLENGGDTTTWWAQYKWLALRNAVSGLSNIYPFNIRYVPTTVKEFGTDYLSTMEYGGFNVVSSGWSILGLNIRIPYGNGRSFKMRVGYKIRPGEVTNIRSANITFEFNVWSKLGN